jgi:hypothetical protein
MRQPELQLTEAQVRVLVRVKLVGSIIIRAD